MDYRTDGMNDPEEDDPESFADMACGGQYAPGTEECDWCPYEKECSGD